MTMAREGPVPDDRAPPRLRDGTPVRIRPTRRQDRGAVDAFLRTLSLDSFELRYFSAVQAEIALEQILAQDPRGDEVSVLMEVVGTSPATVIAQAEYARDPHDRQRAEVAFLVSDAHQGQGAATLLLWDLARRARAQGVTTFTARVLPENFPMRSVFTGAGFPCGLEYFQGETEVTLDVRDEPHLGLIPWMPRAQHAAP